MNARFLAAFLCLSSMVTGCVIVDRPDPCCNQPIPTQRGDITFEWTFGGASCADVPYVKGVRVTIPGERLLNDGFYPCQTNGSAGIVLKDFNPGNYSFTLEAYSYDNQLLYTSSGTFVVNGNVRIRSDLAWAGGSTQGYTYFFWTFPENTTSRTPNCTQAGAASVAVSIDGGAWQTVSCEQGLSGGGWIAPNLATGQHAVQLIAYGSDNVPYYYTSANINVTAGRSQSVRFDFYAVGAAAVTWQLTDGTSPQSCAQAGVSTVFINFYDIAARQYVYGMVGDPHGCNAAPVIYSYLKPGDYYVYIQGGGSNGSSYLSSDTNPPFLRVEAFRQKSVGVQLFRR